MPAIEYRLFFNGSPAKQDQLDSVESIRVQQDVDMAWEATLEIPLCASDSGSWAREDDRILADFARVRVEVKIGTDQWTPLIDGPIVGFDSTMSSEPGQSSVTVRVQDDSVLLNRNEDLASFHDRTDDQIARALFQSIPEIASVRVDSAPPPDTRLESAEMQHGTAMQLLRALARRQNMHAYVLPGSNPGASIGVFRRFPAAKDGLPDMVLLGADRNIARFEVRNRGTQPGRTVGYAVSITDKEVVQRTSSFQRTDLLGTDEGTQPRNAGTYVLPPDQVDSVDLDSAVQAQTDSASYQFEATGQLFTECYGKAMAPYRLVTATGVNGRLSGDYVITGVTHTLNRYTYQQNFKLLRNARSAGSGSAVGPLGKLF